MDDINSKIDEHIIGSGVSGLLMRARSLEGQVAASESELRKLKHKRLRLAVGSDGRKKVEQEILVKIYALKVLMIELDCAMCSMVYGVTKEHKIPVGFQLVEGVKKLL